MSYPKALAKFWTVNSVSVYLDCSRRNHGDSIFGSPEGCWWYCVHEDFDATKLDGYRAAREQGWTYDAEGEWLCPHCSEQDKEEA